jgi:hypothetical protein
MAGFRFAPHAGDKGSIAQNFFVALAENESVCERIGWAPYSVDRGYAAGENVLTVQSVVSVSPPIYTGSDDPKRRIRVFWDADSIGIVIAGDAGRNQSKCYCSNHTQGPPVSRKIVLPSGWNPPSRA